MLRRSLKTLDELEEAEEKEHLEAETPHAPLTSPPATSSDHVTSEHDPFPNVDYSIFSLAYWLNWGGGISTPGASLG